MRVYLRMRVYPYVRMRVNADLHLRIIVNAYLRVRVHLCVVKDTSYLGMRGHLRMSVMQTPSAYVYPGS